MNATVVVAAFMGFILGVVCATMAVLFLVHLDDKEQEQQQFRAALIEAIKGCK